MVSAVERLALEQRQPQQEEDDDEGQLPKAAVFSEASTERFRKQDLAQTVIKHWRHFEAARAFAQWREATRLLRAQREEIKEENGKTVKPRSKAKVAQNKNVSERNEEVEEEKEEPRRHAAPSLRRSESAEEDLLPVLPPGQTGLRYLLLS